MEVVATPSHASHFHLLCTVLVVLLSVQYYVHITRHTLPFWSVVPIRSAYLDGHRPGGRLESGARAAEAVAVAELGKPDHKGVPIGAAESGRVPGRGLPRGRRSTPTRRSSAKAPASARGRSTGTSSCTRPLGERRVHPVHEVQHALGGAVGLYTSCRPGATYEYPYPQNAAHTLLTRFDSRPSKRWSSSQAPTLMA